MRCRIQEFARQVGVDRVKIQLWDCSGSPQYQPYWSVLAKVGGLTQLHARKSCACSLQACPASPTIMCSLLSHPSLLCVGLTHTHRI